MNLRVLFMSNNKIVSLSEIDKLASLDKLEDVLLVGNPIYNEYKDSNNLSEYRVEVRNGRGGGWGGVGRTGRAEGGEGNMEGGVQGGRTRGKGGTVGRHSGTKTQRPQARREIPPA